jgi:hypothetical protein
MQYYGNSPESEQLSLLLDGELDSSHESSLFAELATNEELRSEFKDLLNIKDTIKADSEAYAIPVDATVGVFSKLGFTNALNLVKFHGAQTASAGLFRRFLAPVVSALVFFIIGGGLVSLYYENYENTRVGEHKSLAVTKSYETGTNNPFVFNNNGENVDYWKRLNYLLLSGEYRNRNSHNASSVDITDKIPVSNEEYNAQQTLQQSLPYEHYQIDNAKIASANLNAFYETMPTSSIQNASFPVAQLYSPSAVKSGGDNFNITMRGISGYSFPNIAQPTDNNKLFANLSIGLFMINSNNHSFGIEAGQEPFGQRFTHNDGERTFEVEQNPMIYWVGIAYKYTFPNIEKLGGFRPFGQCLLGFTELGPIFRSLGGLQFIAGNGFGFMIGLEGSLLVYDNQRKRYTTGKLGLSYGLTYNF